MEKPIKSISELDFFEINIVVNAHVLLDKSWDYKLHDAPFSRIYYVKNGTGSIIHNGKTVKLKPGNIYLIPPDLPVALKCEEDETLEKIYFHIYATTSEKYDLLATLPQKVYSMPFSDANAEKIFEHYEENSYISLLQIKKILYETVIAFLSKGHESNTQIKHYSKIVREAISYIQLHFCAKFNIQELADSLFVSKSKINKLFKQETGMTINQYNEDLLFARAKILLTQKQISIQNISFVLGFCDQFYFSRRFKKRFNITPSQYRKEQYLLSRQY